MSSSNMFICAVNMFMNLGAAAYRYTTIADTVHCFSSRHNHLGTKLLYDPIACLSFTIAFAATAAAAATVKQLWHQPLSLHMPAGRSQDLAGRWPGVQVL